MREEGGGKECRVSRTCTVFSLLSQTYSVPVHRYQGKVGAGDVLLFFVNEKRAACPFRVYKFIEKTPPLSLFSLLLPRKQKGKKEGSKLLLRGYLFVFVFGKFRGSRDQKEPTDSSRDLQYAVYCTVLSVKSVFLLLVSRSFPNHQTLKRCLNAAVLHCTFLWQTPNVPESVRENQIQRIKHPESWKSGSGITSGASRICLSSKKTRRDLVSQWSSL